MPQDLQSADTLSQQLINSALLNCCPYQRMAGGFQFDATSECYRRA